MSSGAVRGLERGCLGRVLRVAVQHHHGGEWAIAGWLHAERAWHSEMVQRGEAEKAREREEKLRMSEAHQREEAEKVAAKMAEVGAKVTIK